MTAFTPTYYDHSRTDLLAWGSTSGRRVLDIGCGAGANADWLRQHGAEWIEGVEMHRESAETAASRFDLVRPVRIEAALPQMSGPPFDLIICADVIEHLPDADSVLRGLRSHVAESGALLVSIPNVRHYRSLMRIAFGAGFRPETEGVFDATHVRFFTRHNLASLLIESGWQPIRWGYPSYTRIGGSIRSVLSRLTASRTDEWLAGQWFVLARPA